MNEDQITLNVNNVIQHARIGECCLNPEDRPAFLRRLASEFSRFAEQGRLPTFEELPGGGETFQERIARPNPTYAM